METQTLKVQRTIFDLDTMEEVTLVKAVNFEPVGSTQEALVRLGNNANKFLEVINRGLKSEEQASAVSNPSIPWQIEDEDGELSTFEGTPADNKQVNALVLGLAKTVFGYSKDAGTDKKREAKASAIEMIRSNDQIREGLKKNAAAVTVAE